MGLDQYLYLVGKGPQDPRELVREDGSFDDDRAHRLGYRWCSCGDPGELRAELSDIEGLASVVRATEDDVDYDAARRDAGASPESRLGWQAWGPGYTALHFSDGTRAVYENGAQPPTRTVERTFLIWSASEVAYWRKDYDLDAELARLYGGEMANCGWHRVSPEMLEAIKRSSPDHSEEGWDALDVDAVEAGGQVLAYHIWY